ncbi:glycosyltransferase, partial [Acinetobacter baumannii]|nr:glycosyltransferase [Acinetobacter baumannii]
TDVPGCRETVIDGVNGFLVPKWDPQSLADRMCFFIEHPEQINIMGQESYKIALEKFDVNKVNEKLLKILTL